MGLTKEGGASAERITKDVRYRRWFRFSSFRTEIPSLMFFFFFSVVVSFPVISSGGDGLVGLPGLNQLIAEDETKTLQDFNSYM